MDIDLPLRTDEAEKEAPQQYKPWLVTFQSDGQPTINNLNQLQNQCWLRFLASELEPVFWAVGTNFCGKPDLFFLAEKQLVG